MIPVTAQPEPADFDVMVRQPGRQVLLELIGSPEAANRRGPRRKVVAERIADIPSSALEPLWRHCLPKLHEAYKGVCAYTAFYIHRVTGGRTVDHYVAKAGDPGQAYEWANFRLACSMVNARKSDVPYVLDPFSIGQDWFQLELVSFQVFPNPSLPEVDRLAIQATIDRLDLNDADCRQTRATEFQMYFSNQLPLAVLHLYSPFLAREMVRQRFLRQEDLAT
jgi:hypothetical protein